MPNYSNEEGNHDGDMMTPFPQEQGDDDQGNDGEDASATNSASFTPRALRGRRGWNLPERLVEVARRRPRANAVRRSQAGGLSPLQRKRPGTRRTTAGVVASRWGRHQQQQSAVVDVGRQRKAPKTYADAVVFKATAVDKEPGDQPLTSSLRIFHSATRIAFSTVNIEESCLECKADRFEDCDSESSSISSDRSKRFSSPGGNGENCSTSACTHCPDRESTGAMIPIRSCNKSLVSVNKEEEKYEDNNPILCDCLCSNDVRVSQGINDNKSTIDPLIGMTTSNLTEETDKRSLSVRRCCTSGRRNPVPLFLDCLEVSIQCSQSSRSLDKQCVECDSILLASNVIEECWTPLTYRSPVLEELPSQETLREMAQDIAVNGFRCHRLAHEVTRQLWAQGTRRLPYTTIFGTVTS